MTYNSTTHAIQVMLEAYCRHDNHIVQPHELYNAIVKSLETSSVVVTAVIFDISISLVWMIKDEHEAKNHNTAHSRKSKGASTKALPVSNTFAPT